LTKPYDATAKDLLEVDPPAWLALIGIAPTGPVRVVDSDLATVTASADKVLLVEGPVPFLVHYEFQASRDPTFPHRLLWYNVLLGYRHQLPVVSVVVLMRPSAEMPGLNGQTNLVLPDGQVYHSFAYRVVRVWEESADHVLAGPLGTLPLAPISAVDPEQLPEILSRLCQRLQEEPDKTRSSRLLSAAKILMGLRHPPPLVNELFEGVLAMFHGLEESSIIQSWLEQGRAEGEVIGRAKGEVEGRAKGEVEGRAKGQVEAIRSMLMNQGEVKFGPAGPQIVEQVNRIHDADRLAALAIRLLTVETWEELLAGPDDNG
jgi:predicted transposase YdaD